MSPFPITGFQTLDKKLNHTQHKGRYYSFGLVFSEENCYKEAGTARRTKN